MNALECPTTELVDAALTLPTVVTGTLVGFVHEGRTPLVSYPGQPSPGAIEARTVVDLSGIHIGRNVVLMFDAGDPRAPIVMGCVRDTSGWPLEARPGQVEIDVDGERMIISANHQLVLRCGKASITLTKAGKVLIEGTYISSRSSGAHRIKGGSVQLN